VGWTAVPSSLTARDGGSPTLPVTDAPVRPVGIGRPGHGRPAPGRGHSGRVRRVLDRPVRDPSMG